MSSNWWPERFTISDDAGTARFEVRNSPGLATRLSLIVHGGEEIDAIRRRRGGRRSGQRGLAVNWLRRGSPDRRCALIAWRPWLHADVACGGGVWLGYADAQAGQADGSCGQEQGAAESVDGSDSEGVGGDAAASE